MLRCVLSLAVLTKASALSSFKVAEATSHINSKLISNSRILEDDGNYSGMSWVRGYSIKFEHCEEIIQYGLNENGDNYGGAGQVSTERIVVYRLCPTDTCNSDCSKGALYAVSLDSFMEAYTDTMVESQEDICEAVKAKCSCYYDDDEETCLEGCYAKAGVDYCADGDALEYKDCIPVQRSQYMYYNYNNRNSYNYGNSYQYKYRNSYRFRRFTCYNEDCTIYIAPQCSSDGSAILLGTYIDDTCSTPAPSGTYESYNNGASLPFSSSSSPLVSNECMSCNENDGNGNYGELEMCEELYESALKCEENITDVAYPDSSSCYFIRNILPDLDAVAKASSNYYRALYYSLIPLTLLVVVVALAAPFYNKFRRSRVNLSDQGFGFSATD